MRYLPAGVALALLLACGGGAGNPGDAVLDMFSALQEGNGEKVVSYMSSSAMEQMEVTLDQIRSEPEAVAYLSMLGIELTAEDLEGMSAPEFTARLVESPMISGIMSSAVVEIGEVTIEGDTAMVDVTTTVAGNSETHTIPVVMEGGSWKVTEFGMNL